jgi:hypothetical protein
MSRAIDGCPTFIRRRAVCLVEVELAADAQAGVDPSCQRFDSSLRTSA